MTTTTDSTTNGSGSVTPVKLTRKDFMSDQIIRWCPGCGDYSILSQVQTVFASLGIQNPYVAAVMLAAAFAASDFMLPMTCPAFFSSRKGSR